VPLVYRKDFMRLPRRAATISGNAVCNSGSPRAANFQDRAAAFSSCCTSDAKKSNGHATFGTIHQGARTVATGKVVMIGEFHGGAHGEFSEFEQ